MTIIRSTKHGHAGARRGQTYNAWCAMRARCKNLNDLLYGGRGIRYAPQWEDFEVFLADVGYAPSSKHSIDRFPDKNWQGAV